MSNQENTGRPKALAPDMRGGKGLFAKSVGAFVPKVTAAVFQKFGFHSAEIMASWPTIVGPDLARLTAPESIKWPRGSKAAGDLMEDGGSNAGATLIVATEPAFALEVSYRHKELIDRINRYFGYRAIAQIKVHQVPRTEEPSAAPVPPRKAPAERVVLDKEDLTAALEALGRSVAAARSR